jgi:hypothetical protein
MELITRLREGSESWKNKLYLQSTQGKTCLILIVSYEHSSCLTVHVLPEEIHLQSPQVECTFDL